MTLPAEKPDAVPAMTPQQRELSGKSGLKAYFDFAVGSGSWFEFLYFEFCQLFLSGLGGLAGYGARRLCYPAMFKSCGRKPAVGRNVIVRNPAKITLGNGIILDDFSCIDARGGEASIKMGDGVSLGRFSSVVAKNGRVGLEHGVNIGTHCRIATQSRIQIGESTLVAAYCYIGPGNHQSGPGSEPIISREMEIKGGVIIGSNSWIGAHTTILDGSVIGKNAVIGAHSLVNGSVPENSVAVGVPAKVIKVRD